MHLFLPDKHPAAEANAAGSDDLTVEVIFFGEGDSNGSVVVNKEASASAQDIKSKL